MSNKVEMTTKLPKTNAVTPIVIILYKDEFTSYILIYE